MPTPCPKCKKPAGHPHQRGCPELARIRREQERALRMLGIPKEKR